MSPRIVSLTAMTGILLGLWLPSLWLASPDEARPRLLHLPAPPSPPPSRDSLATLMHRQHSPMGMLQAVVTGMADRSFDAGAGLQELRRLGFSEAEEVAGALAGETAGGKVRDAAAFLKAIARQDSSAFEFSALAAWAEANPDEALTHLVKMSGNSVSYRYYFIRRLAEQNPDKVLAMLKTAPPSKDTPHLWNAALAGCADRSTAFAMQMIQAAPAGVRQRAVQSLLEKLAADDPRAALTWRESLPPELREGTETEAVFRQWAKSDPATALQEWEQQKNNSGAPPAALLSHWAEKDPEALLQWARQRPEGFVDVNGMIIQSFARTDPDRAMKILAGASTAEKREMLPVMGETLARRDPQAALAWWRSLPAEEKSGTLQRMIPGLSALPVEERRVLAREAGTGTPDGFLLLYQADRAEAEKTLAELPPDKALAICKSMTGDLSETSPAAAVPFVEVLVQSAMDFANAPAATNKNPDAEDFDEPTPDWRMWEAVYFVAGFTTQWAALDPAAVSTWIGTLPAGKPQTAAAANLAITWGRHDLAAARAWAEQLPDREARVKAMVQITRIENSSRPAAKNP